MRDIFVLEDGESRAITWENQKGEKGKGGMAKSHLGPKRKGSAYVPLVKAHETVTLADIDGCGIITHIWMTCTDKISDKSRYVLKDLVVRMYWDNAEKPSVECPIGDFFCLGFGASYDINSALVSVNPLRAMNMYIPMPFKSHAEVTITNDGDEDLPAFFYQIDYQLKKNLPDNSGYFHCQYRHERTTRLKEDYTILDQVEGKGQYIGTFVSLTTLQRDWYGEGEVKFYLDNDVEYPTICGTGMEDYFGGAWSFGPDVEHTFSSLNLGFPYYSRQMEDDMMLLPQRTFYRWHVTDPILFSENIRVTLQQIGINANGMFERQDDLSSVAYYYLDHVDYSRIKLEPREERYPR